MAPSAGRRGRGAGLPLTEESFRALVEAAPDIVSICAIDGTILSLNPAFERVTGWRADQWVGKRFDGLLHPEDMRPARRSLERLTRGQQVGPEGRRVRTRAGSFIVMDVSSRLLARRGRAFGVLSIGRDATERVRLEEANARLAAIVESSEDSIISASLDGTILSWNRGAENLYGFSAEEAVGASVFIFMPPEERPRVAQVVERLRRGEHLGHFDIDKVTKAGRRIVVSVTISAIRDASGALKAFSAISRDVTERKRAEAELRSRAEELLRANEELELFTSAASHELREPVRKIFGYADLIKAEAGPRLAPGLRSHVERIQDAAVRMNRLIEDLLAFSAAQRAKMPAEPLSLTEVAREAASELEAEAAAAGGEIEVLRLPPAFGNRAMLKAVFLGLLDNAIKFRKPGVPPRVRLTGRLKDGFAELEVEDNGFGFDERHLAGLFKPFKRLHGRGAYPGTGMGLSLCKRIIERLGGSIAARGAPGKGSTFVVRLPQGRPGGVDGSSQTSHQ